MTKPPYHVLYSKMGKTEKDTFVTLDEAIKDYKEKLRLDKLQVFDDRFVLGIEDADGNTVKLG
jgi:hypothetical protein